MTKCQRARPCRAERRAVFPPETLHAHSDHPANRDRPEDRISIQLLRAVNVCYARIWHQVVVKSPHYLTHDGAGIVVCNHTSHLDPALIQSVLPRLVTWMMTHDFYDVKWTNWFYRTIGAIRVERKGRDMPAVRGALRALQEGRILGIFPEGRIETDDEFLPFQSGAAAIAIKAGVPVYPAFLDGSQRRKSILQTLLARQRSMLIFGPPLNFSKSEDPDRATEMIREAMLNLRTIVRSKRTDARIS